MLKILKSCTFPLYNYLCNYITTLKISKLYYPRVPFEFSNSKKKFFFPLLPVVSFQGAFEFFLLVNESRYGGQSISVAPQKLLIENSRSIFVVSRNGLSSRMNGRHPCISRQSWIIEYRILHEFFTPSRNISRDNSLLMIRNSQSIFSLRFFVNF